MIPSRARLVLPGIAWLVVLALVTSNRVTGQVPSATGSIFGEVIDAATGQPVPGALVLLDDARPNFAGPTPVDEHAPMPNGAIPPKRAIASGAGQFVFHDLPKSTYSLQAGAAGYLDGVYGQASVSTPGRRVDLGPGEHLANVNIKLWKLASLSGRVIDEAGEPAVGMVVRAYRVSLEGTRRTLTEAGLAETDDRGIYRIGALPPANYVVGLPQTITTMPVALMNTLERSDRPDFAPAYHQIEISGGPYSFIYSLRGIRVGDLEIEMTTARSIPIAPSSTSSRLLAYRTVFFPSASSASEATVLTLASGQDRAGIDLPLRSGPTARVSGSVVGPSGPVRSQGVHLTKAGAPAENEGGDVAGTATDVDGNFTFLAVAPGEYIVRTYQVPPQLKVAAQPPGEDAFFAQAPLSIGDRDVDHVMLTLVPGARIRGRIVFPGADAALAASMFKQTMIVPINASGGKSSIPQLAAADGTFSTRGLPPGPYLIQSLDFPGWTFLSATVGGRDLEDAPIDLQSSDVSGVVVTYTNQPTRLTGTVHTSDGGVPADSEALIVAFPTNYAAWFEHGMAQRRLRILPPGRDGTYAITGLPPGDYTLAAVPWQQIGDGHSAAFFDALARAGTHVTLAAGQGSSIDLTVRPIR